MMSESQAIQSIMNAELEVYRQKGRVLELEADNAALRLAHGKMVAQFDELTSFIGCEFDPQTETWVSGKAPYLSAGTTEVEACKAAVDALRSVAKVLEDKCKQAQSERAALRLKVQEYNSALDAMTARYVVLEKLVKAIPPANNPYELVAIIEHGNETAYNNVAALLTRRQGMGG